MIALAPGTASAPPSQKSFCTSTTINASFGILYAPSQWREVSTTLFMLEGGDPGIERAGLDGVPQSAHDVLVVPQIVPRQEHGSENLLGTNEMVKIGPAVVSASGTDALIIDRSGIVTV